MSAVQNPAMPAALSSAARTWVGSAPIGVAGVPWYDFAVCAVHPGHVRARGGLTLAARHGLESLDDADTVLVLPVLGYVTSPPSPALTAGLRRAHRDGARIASLCLGAFALAAAGLLDGRDATTHWRFCDQLGTAYPAVRVVPEVLFVDAGDVLTSGGVAAGIDLCLHLVRSDHGAEVANRLSRRLVTGPHRDGGQAQYIETPVPDEAASPLADVLGWALEHLDAPLTIDLLAHRAHMSPRTFMRHFKDSTGTTPRQWLLTHRVELARRLLESTDLPVRDIARRAGFTTDLGLRQQFHRRVGLTPSGYRRAFATR